MMMLQIAWRYLWGRRLRSALTTLAIVFGIMIVFGLNGIIPAVRSAFDANMTLAIHEVDLILLRSDGASFPTALADELRATPGVAEVTPVLERTLRLPAADALPTGDGRPIASLTINGWDPGTSEAVVPIRPIAGRWLTPQDTRGALVRASLTRRTGLGLGDTLRLPAASGSITVAIVGILPERPLFGDEEVYLTLPTAQELFNMPGQINAIAGQFDDDQDVAALRDSIVARLGPGYTAGGVSAGGSEWRSVLQIGELTFTLFGVLALAMGGFIMLNTFRTSIAERQRDIGMLRAIGASRGMVTRIVLAESLLLGALGTALGMLLGYLLVMTLVVALSPTWESFFGVPLGSPAFSAPLIGLSLALGLGVPLLSGLIPAIGAGRITPLAALRPEPQASGSRRPGIRAAIGGALIVIALFALASGFVPLALPGALLLLSSLIILAPLLVAPTATLLGRLLGRFLTREGAIAQGNLLRNPGRAAVTASTIMISLAILVALAGLTSTFTTGLMGYLERSMRADYLLLPEALVLGQGNVEAGPQLAQQVRDTPGIAAVTTLRRSTTQIGGDTAQVIGIEPQGYAQLAGLIFTQGDPARAYMRLADGDAIIVNGILATQQRLAVGSMVTLETPAGPRPYEVVGIGLDYLNSRLATAYISQAELAASFRQENDVLLMANRSPDADPAAVEAALLEIAEAYPAFSLLSFEQWRQSQLAGNQTRTNILYVLMALLATPSLIALANTLAINVLERTREIGVLRAIGADRGQIVRMIIGESLLLAALGIAGGLIAGVGLGYAIVGSLSLAGLPFGYAFPLDGMLLTIGVGVAFALLAALLPARRAARLDIVAALRYE
jgi:putative ABC transport system permease protein